MEFEHDQKSMIAITIMGNMDSLLNNTSTAELK